MPSNPDYQVPSSDAKRRWHSRLKHDTVVAVLAISASIFLASQLAFDRWGFSLLLRTFPTFCDNHMTWIGAVAASVPICLYFGLMVGMFVDGLVLSLNQKWKLAFVAWWCSLISVIGIYESWCLGWRISGN